MALAQAAAVAWLLAGTSAPAAAQAPQNPPSEQSQPPAQNQPPAQSQPSEQSQPPSQSQPASQASPSSSVISAQVQDQELETFAKTARQVSQIRNDTKDQPKDEANQKMAAAIQACGMKVERFNELARAVSSDPQLNQRFQTTQQELTSKGDVTCGPTGSDKR